jgi:hypothetical protein
MTALHATDSGRAQQRVRPLIIGVGVRARHRRRGLHGAGDPVVGVVEAVLGGGGLGGEPRRGQRSVPLRTVRSSATHVKDQTGSSAPGLEVSPQADRPPAQQQGSPAQTLLSYRFADGVVHGGMICARRSGLSGLSHGYRGRLSRW